MSEIKIKQIPDTTAEVGNEPPDSRNIEITDDRLLARFDGDTRFQIARKGWSDEQSAAFCRMARLVHATGLDWYHTSIPQIRFGRRSPQNMRAEGTLGTVQLRKGSGFLEFSHQHARLDLAGT